MISDCWAVCLWRDETPVHFTMCIAVCPTSSVVRGVLSVVQVLLAMLVGNRKVPVCMSNSSTEAIYVELIFTAACKRCKYAQRIPSQTRAQQ